MIIHVILEPLHTIGVQRKLSSVLFDLWITNMAGGSTDFIYGSIFTVYMACFLFIGAYLMVRRRRKEIESNAQPFKLAETKKKS